MIRLARDADLAELALLWQEAFGDTAEETAFYFQTRHRNEYLLLQEDDRGINGMLSMLPLELSAGETRLSARYVFAVATRKERRGEGISTRLLEAAHGRAEEEGCAATLLVPAEPSLFEYYGKRGYQTAFLLDEISLTAQEIAMRAPSGQVSFCSAPEYKALRDKAFAGSSLYAAWGQDALEYIKTGAEASGGAMIRLNGEGLQAAALCEARGNIMRVSELALVSGTWQRAMALIHQEINADAYQLRMQQGCLRPGATRPFGMIHWLRKPLEISGSPPYLAFAKD